MGFLDSHRLPDESQTGDRVGVQKHKGNKGFGHERDPEPSCHRKEPVCEIHENHSGPQTDMPKITWLEKLSAPFALAPRAARRPRR